jgi:methyltransferase (TIGR00027 family)
MKTGRSSLTAYHVALRRAAHQWIDEPRILDDPLAVSIIGADQAEKLKSNLTRERRPIPTGLRVFVVVRSRCAEDMLAESMAKGVGQYVVLGAGLDTSAYRSPWRESGLRMFEVDHPATQAWKRKRLAAAAIQEPPGLAFVPVDFEADSLVEALRSRGFDEKSPAFFSWLGVTPYLTHDALFGTLRFIASLPRGTTVVFDYALAPSALSWRGRILRWFMARRVAKIGEPWRTSFLPDQLDAELREIGFHELLDLDAHALNDRYCRGRADGLRLRGFGRVMKATV